MPTTAGTQTLGGLKGRGEELPWIWRGIVSDYMRKWEKGVCQYLCGRMSTSSPSLPSNAHKSSCRIVERGNPKFMLNTVKGTIILLHSRAHILSLIELFSILIPPHANSPTCTCGVNDVFYNGKNFRERERTFDPERFLCREPLISRSITATRPCSDS